MAGFNVQQPAPQRVNFWRNWAAVEYQRRAIRRPASSDRGRLRPNGRH